MSMLEDPNVKLLIDTFELKHIPPEALEVSEYEYVEGQGIVIKKVKLLDASGNYIRFAKLKELTPYLHRFPIKFRGEQSTKKTDQGTRE
jgi:hypothetical protein